MAMQIEAAPTSDVTVLPQQKIDKDGLFALRRLSERGAVLAVARDMETAVVVREDDQSGSLRKAVVETSVAQAMALRNWISCKDPDVRIAKYFITAEGKRAVRELIAEEENQACNLSDTTLIGEAANLKEGRSRYIVAENPVMSLSQAGQDRGSVHKS